MKLNVRGVRYNPSEETMEFLNKKLDKLSFADDYLQDIDMVITREAKGIGFHISALIHFKWKVEKMVEMDCYELYEGIELIADKMQSVIKKEKDKVVNN